MQSSYPVQREAVLEVQFPVYVLGELLGLAWAQCTEQNRTFIVKKRVQGSRHEASHCAAKWSDL